MKTRYIYNKYFKSQINPKEKSLLQIPQALLRCINFNRISILILTVFLLQFVVSLNCTKKCDDFHEIKEKPNLTEPADNSEFWYPSKIVFKWEKVPNAEFYEVIVNGKSLCKIDNTQYPLEEGAGIYS